MTMPRQKPGRSKQDYQTPPEFIAAVKKRLGIVEFDYDIAASPINAQAADYITAEQDALALTSWRFGDGWNWLNPPFNNIGNFAERCVHEWCGDNVRTAMLVPASVGSNWWRDYVHCCPDTLALFLNGRLTFVGETMPYPKDCALVLYGGANPSDDIIYDVWSWRE